MTKIQLTGGRSSRDRFYLIRDGLGMGGHGKPTGHFSKEWVVVNGVDRGRGYQSYCSVEYALTCVDLPDDAKSLIRQTLNLLGSEEKQQ